MKHLRDRLGGGWLALGLPVILWLVLWTLSCDSGVSSEKSVVRADTVTTFRNAHHFIDFGTGENERSITREFVFPQSLDAYRTIDMHVSLSCPEGECDPWDRFAAITVVRDMEEIEIGRYITPYGVGCSWSIDVTDYRKVLQGSVELKSFIDTWVATGWLLTVRFVMTEGEPDFTDIDVENVWMGRDVVYGDPSRPPLQPGFRIPDVAGTSRIVARIVNTGHGQGNTGNAAEFLRATHGLYLDGALQSEHVLWRTDCAQNACSPQQGNWQFSRAGWCPGAAVRPLDVDLTSAVGGHGGQQLEYRLADYENLCRPDNPSCSSGTTCQSCDYDGGAHTEPHYKISFQLLTYR